MILPLSRKGGIRGKGVPIMPKDQANPLLEQLLEELKGREVAERFRPRILITGSIIDNPALIRTVEEEGVW